MRRGRSEEERVKQEFTSRGYTLLAENYRRNGGELDLVFEKGGVVYFVEVKKDNGVFRALDRITPLKLNRMRRAAEAFLAEMGFEGEVGFYLAVVGRSVELLRIDEHLL